MPVPLSDILYYICIDLFQQQQQKYKRPVNIVDYTRIKVLKHSEKKFLK